jgi:hypothetical protein
MLLIHVLSIIDQYHWSWWWSETVNSEVRTHTLPSDWHKVFKKIENADMKKLCTPILMSPSRCTCALRRSFVFGFRIKGSIISFIMFFKVGCSWGGLQRLDRETSGCMTIAKNEAAYYRYVPEFQDIVTYKLRLHLNTGYNAMSPNFKTWLCTNFDYILIQDIMNIIHAILEWISDTRE